MTEGKIWLAQMPEAFKYGFMVLAETREEAERELKKEFFECRKAAANDGMGWSCSWWTFDEAMEYFGGSIGEIELGKVYNDGFMY